MNVLRIFCFALFFLTGCSVIPTHEDSGMYPQTAKALWFRTDAETARPHLNGKIPAHPFFDLAPLLNTRDATISVYVVTPAKSTGDYGLDIVSGRRYLKNIFCETEDLNGIYRGSIRLPSYTEAIIPRFEDGTGRPIKVYIFGGEKHLKTDTKVLSWRVRIVGGLVVKDCLAPGECREKSDWSVRQIVLAVDPFDDEWKDVRTLEELKKKLDWTKITAQMVNIYGRKMISSTSFSFTKITKELGLEKTLESLGRFSVHYDFEKMRMMQASCQKLYNYVWDSLLLAKDDLVSEQNVFRFGVDRKTVNVTVPEGEEEMTTGQNDKTPQTFFTTFMEIHKKVGNNLASCFRRVSPSNINSDPDRHWFFAYLQAFYALRGQGYVFDCSSGGWRAAKPWRGVPPIKFDSLLEKCTPFSLNVAFPRAVTTLHNLRKAAEPTYDYITYDGGPLGTHEKIYSWVEREGRKLYCTSKDEVQKLERDFPSEVVWKNRAFLAK